MIYSSLVNNITLIIALSILYSFVIRRWESGSRTGRVISGFLFGAVAVIGMMNPLVISPGLIFDGRSIIISIAGFIGGGVTALIAAVMAIVYRIWIGGPGVIMGVSVTVSSAAIGIAYHYFRRRNPRLVAPLHLIVFGIIVHVCMVALMMTLPSGLRSEIFSRMAVPILLIYPLGTLLVSIVLLDSESRLRAEADLRENEALFRSYLENAPDGVYLNDLEGNFIYGNRKCEEIIDYRREDLIGKNFQSLSLLPDSSLEKALQLLQANREARTTGPDELDLIRKDGSLVPVEINTNLVQRAGQTIVLAFVRDITERKQVEQKLRETLESLRKAVGATIQVMVSVLEVRDPYTAGHQMRVADLARSIAAEMGLPQEQVDGIRLAGSIHDIGKLSIPAEILSKPTALTKIESALVREHAQQGFEILKDVESPWPLAQIIHQHHERLDGSGYPRNLKGDDILIEARILAVADVVEAIASHRPYRPGKGIDAALDEIEKQRGVHYDASAVDACLRLFREKGFRFADFRT
ncbi:MAG: PAS domain S-box protein [Deltaproteobacteria bacterium]|nr:PAS domain S-box protein [Deltaproteobacteria bacterium]